ncbi:MAG TPA: hypothetical protein VK779_08675 [Rhizomicrobium sp.]|jgi:hypothetical protein|nr:hypothetical protein [Rhizomicrobium sp.]
MHSFSKSLILAAFVTASLAGVSKSFADDTKIDENSPSYVTGFTDGCATANPRYRKENNLEAKRDPSYDTDANYKKGWDKGYYKCEDKMDSGGLPIPGNSVIM